MSTFDALASSTAAASAASASSASASSRIEAGSAERFLKMLVTQMQNQDPLNPLDNAQITSQMAQINTVSGIERLNDTVASLNAQYARMQTLQGAALVGRDVSLKGDRIAVQGGRGVGGFDLAGTASRVLVEVLSPAGRVVDTIDLGTQGAGRHGFEWNAAAKGVADGTGHRFRVLATSGAATVSATPLMRDRVESVSLAGNRLTLDTRLSGQIDYDAVQAVN
ncbi:MAG: flagellar hook assembly protein FlgD [Pseudomonadota bacterium]|jgi:flagellar basal-body rod modification protein FlgD|nr:flagellar hook assembly protein FlgD [Rubrivivax sp.]MCA3257843.1 flagellar hook assembly protein FlgD [Rubrivivax sp.]MCE2911686.1 flagellar hook assembly protein FlgD [Rubrivivax sp.]MCZ8030533.1 flagellar hook assembly protein FlgD [Rubrivivax sp.]